MSEPSDRHALYALVVDDDGLIRMDAIDMLEEAEFRTFEASDGDKAMVLLAREQAVIVLLFTDVQMPGSRDGFAVARETARRWPHIAIVVASGSRSAGTRRPAGRGMLHRQAVHRRDGARPPEGHSAGRTEAGAAPELGVRYADPTLHGTSTAAPCMSPDRWAAIAALAWVSVNVRVRVTMPARGTTSKKPRASARVRFATECTDRSSQSSS